MIPVQDPETQRWLVEGLARQLGRAHGRVSVHETHLSWVLVAGEEAWKVKKAVHLDFVDFSTLEKRRHYCHEEVRLNRRMAPELYLGVEAITGTPAEPVPGGSGEAIEYAVRMKAFPQDCLWSHRLASAGLSGREAAEFGEKLARFHMETAIARADSPWGSAEGVADVAHGNLATIKALVPERGRRLAGAFAEWTEAELKRLAPAFGQRMAGGFIRDCHGDLHAGNILTLAGKVEVFDCIDFNESLRWIDVINDLAFIDMDLRRHGRPDLAGVLLNRYLEVTGDYEGLMLLRYYAAQRAAVRCKVALLLASQLAAGSREAEAARAEARSCLEFCEQLSHVPTGRLLITCGFSGSGKSSFTQRMAECADIVRLRSDLERKRLAGMTPTARDGATSGLYAEGMTGMTYARLESLSRILLAAGVNVVVDATFLAPRRRESFARLAASLSAPFTILELRASDRVLSERVARRAAAGQDPSDATLDVLDRQFARYVPLSDAERAHAVSIDAEKEFDDDTVRRACAQAGLPTWPRAPQSTA